VNGFGGSFAALWIGMSLLFLAIGGYFVYEQEVALREHEPTEATVVGTDIERDVDRNVGEPDDVTYTPKVRYRYEVDGETHTSTNVFPGGTPGRGDRGWAEEITSDYGAGDEVTVYYDPDEPGEAYLVQKRSYTKFAFVVLPLVFVAIGVALVLRDGSDGDGTDSTSASTDADSTAASEDTQDGGQSVVGADQSGDDSSDVEYSTRGGDGE